MRFNPVLLAGLLRDAAKEKAGVNAEEKTHMAIDGKTMKRSHNRAKGLGPMHMVSAWLSEFGLTLAQVATEEKSNEITAIPELMRLIDLKGAIITIDAMELKSPLPIRLLRAKVITFWH